MGDRMGSSPIDRTTKLMKRVHIAPFLHAHAAVMYVGVHSLTPKSKEKRYLHPFDQFGSPYPTLVYSFFWLLSIPRPRT